MTLGLVKDYGSFRCRTCGTTVVRVKLETKVNGGVTVRRWHEAPHDCTKKSLAAAALRYAKEPR